MSGIEQNIIKQIRREGGKLPDKIVNSPELKLGLELYFQAFYDLTNDRTIGQFSLGPIPWSKVQYYAVENEYDPEQTERLHYFCEKMDLAYLKKANDVKKS